MTIAELRHLLHQNAELSLEEKETPRIIAEFLREHTGLELMHTDGWVLAVYRAQNPARPPIAFRADIDALPMEEGIELAYASKNPNCAHKCGHDGHSAALAGFAQYIDSLEPDRDVYLIFQPAEETGAGAKMCAEVIDSLGISEIYACHNWSGFPERAVIVHRGTAQCASQGLTVSFTGTPAHAGEPEHGSNPCAAIARLVTWLGERNSRPGEPLVMSTIVGIDAGSRDFGMSASKGEIFATLRAERESDLERLVSDLKREADRLCAEYGLKVSFEDSDVFPETANDETCAEKVLKAAGSYGFKTIIPEKPLRPSEDFGHYLRNRKGAIFYVGSGVDYPALHTREYDFPDGILGVIIKVFKGILVQ